MPPEAEFLFGESISAHFPRLTRLHHPEREPAPVLKRLHLGNIAKAITLGHRTVRIIPFNISFVLTLKAVFLTLALLGHTTYGSPSSPTARLWQPASGTKQAT